MTARVEPRVHHDVDRLISEDELESLLSWWRTTAKNRYGEPLFCAQHFEHTGACRQCAAIVPTRCRRG